MAIKINGTTVIDDSRNLINIANLDIITPKSNEFVTGSSTTWTVPTGVTRIGVLAVGGGPGGGTQSWYGLHQNSGVSGVLNYTVSPGDSISITVGAGSSNGAASGGTTSVTNTTTSTLIVQQTGGTPGDEGIGSDNPTSTGSGTFSSALNYHSSDYFYILDTNARSSSYNAADAVNWFPDAIGPALYALNASTLRTVSKSLLDTFRTSYYNKSATRPNAANAANAAGVAWSTSSAYQPGAQGRKASVNTSDTTTNASGGVGGAVFIYY